MARCIIRRDQINKLYRLREQRFIDKMKITMSLPSLTVVQVDDKHSELMLKTFGNVSNNDGTRK